MRLTLLYKVALAALKIEFYYKSETKEELFIL